MARIAVMGVSGFIGGEVATDLLRHDQINVRGLSRNPPKITANTNLSWRRCDLHSLLDIEMGLAGCDIGIYLVHSMLPSARLTQGSFRDHDMILADNFARAAQLAGLKRIVYLGGLVPEAEEISEHLASRYEVEQVLKSYQTPVTALRAGLIVGSQGSSFQILLKLVQRAPFLPCPPWTRHQTSTIAIDDVVAAVSYEVQQSIQSDDDNSSAVYDLSGPDSVSYHSLLERTAKLIGSNRWFPTVPWLPTSFVKQSVRFVSGAPINLVSPLVASLMNAPTARQEKLHVIPERTYTNFDVAAESAITEASEAEERPHAFRLGIFQKQQHSVRAIHRIPLPKGRDAQWLAKIYFLWLRRFFFGAVRTESEGDRHELYFPIIPKPAMILKLSEQRSTPDRQLFYLVGGWLVKPTERPRLEFRSLPLGFAIAAVHDYYPALPWVIYRQTQARVHDWTMKSFAKFLQREIDQP